MDPETKRRATRQPQEAGPIRVLGFLRAAPGHWAVRVSAVCPGAVRAFTQVIGGRPPSPGLMDLPRVLWGAAFFTRKATPSMSAPAPPGLSAGTNLYKGFSRAAAARPPASPPDGVNEPGTEQPRHVEAMRAPALSIAW